MNYLINIAALAFVAFVVACSPVAAPTVTQGDLTAAPSQTPRATPGAATVPAATAGAAGGGGTFTFTSTAFTDGGNIPKKYTCDGASVSPPLKWVGAPGATASFALIVDDPDAPIGTFTHWVTFDIPANQTEIAEGAQNVGKVGQNSARKNGYTGPCPPSGTHHYVFRLYALDVPSLNLAEGATKDQVTGAMQGHILAQAQLTGLYGR